MKLLVTTLTALSVAIGSAGTAAAQTDYPSRTIELLVGFSAGGRLDTLARRTAPYLEEHLGGATVVVVNRPGAGGAVMQTQLAHAEPDGYTLGLLSMPGLVTVLFGGDVEYSVDDFAYAGTFTFEPHSLMVGADTPYQSLADIIDAARKAPGSVTVGGAGIGSAAHLALKVLEREAGVTFNFIPAPGAAEMQNQVLGGHIAGGVTTVSGSIPLHDEGQVRVLGVMSTERVSIAPDVPTMAEAGYDVEWGALRGIAAPAGTPPEIMKKLEDAIVATMNDPEFKEQAARDHQLLSYRDGAAFEKAAHNQYKMLEAMWAEEPWIKQ
jgi:tripartite-type tricarboxylate transporter receptor subunit TctC